MSTTTVTLTDDPAQHPYVFAAAFNSGDPEQVERVYEPGGVLMTESGRALSGAARREATAALMAVGVPIRVEPRSVSANDDLALLVVDWAIAGRSADGRRIDVRGTATDVARRGLDGRWRYAIDNPWGALIRPGAA
jgi:ketosteroid isomerase-like protein